MTTTSKKGNEVAPYTIATKRLLMGLSSLGTPKIMEPLGQEAPVTKGSYHSGRIELWLPQPTCQRQKLRCDTCTSSTCSFPKALRNLNRTVLKIFFFLPSQI